MKHPEFHMQLRTRHRPRPTPNDIRKKRPPRVNARKAEQAENAEKPRIERIDGPSDLQTPQLTTDDETFLFGPDRCEPCSCEQCQASADSSTFVPGPFAPSEVPVPGPFVPGSFASGPFVPGPFAPGPFAPGPFASGPFVPGPFAPGSFAPVLLPVPPRTAPSPGMPLATMLPMEGNSGSFFKNVRQRIKDDTSLSEKERKSLLKESKEVQTSIGKSQDHDPLFILRLPMPLQRKAWWFEKLMELNSRSRCSDEYFKRKAFIEAFYRVPFFTYRKSPVQPTDSAEVQQRFLTTLATSLNQVIRGQTGAKLEILEWAAQQIHANASGRCLGFQGPAGIGKTTLARAVSTALGRPLVSINLGGNADGAFLQGHDYTYEGSTHGALVAGLMDAQCMNPVFFFDELDKVSDTQRGRDIIGQLIHLTDFSQNHDIHDKYFSGTSFDFSKCLFLFSFNEQKDVSPILLNRMTVIHMKGYSKEDKKSILQQFTLPGVLSKFSLTDDQVTIEPDVWDTLLSLAPSEEGMRKANEMLTSLFSKINLCLKMKSMSSVDASLRSWPELSLPLTITKKLVHTLLPKEADDSVVSHMYI